MPTFNYQARFWLFTTAAFLALVWVLGDVLLPFVVGMAVAYLLGPLVGRMIRAGVPRVVAALLILIGFVLAVLAVLAATLPFVYREATQLAANLPAYTAQAQEFLNPYIGWIQERFPAQDMTAYQETLKSNIGKVVTVSGSVLGGVISGGQAVINVGTFIVLTPIVAYFVMAEWVAITRWIDDMIPRPSYTVIRGLLTQIDRKLSGFIRGQVTVSAFLAVLYAVSLSLAGLKFGVLIGLMAGILSIIPLVGSSVGLIVAVLVAWIQSGELGYVALIAAIFLTGQFLEGNVITPRIMGKSVGLHPVWILFALLAGGSLMGIVGMLLAVPVAAVIGVLGGFAIQQYKSSVYYKEPVVIAPPPAIITDLEDVPDLTQPQPPATPQPKP